MFDLDRAIADWRRQIRAAGIKSSETLDELESHLRDDVEERMRSGAAAEPAFTAAVHGMGSAQSLRSEFERIRFMHGMTARFAKILIAGVAGSAAMTGVGLLFKLPFGPELPFSGFAFTALWVAFVWLLQTARRSAVEAGSLLDARMLTADAQKSLEVARAEAARLHHDFIGTEHALLGLFEPAEGVVAKVLRNSGLDRRIVREEIEKIVGVGLVHETTPRLPYTPRLKQAVELAAREASAMGHDRVGPEYLLLGLLVEGQGVAGHVLKNLGVSIAAARAAILREAGGAGGNR